MPIEAHIATSALGLLAGAYMLAMLLWSILYPERRLWPPRGEATSGLKFRVWFMTTAVFAAAFCLGVMDWNRLEWPALIRWGVGVPLIVLGNVAVWRGVFKLGLGATSGDASGPQTDGL